MAQIASGSPYDGWDEFWGDVFVAYSLSPIKNLPDIWDWWNEVLTPVERMTLMPPWAKHIDLRLFPPGTDPRIVETMNAR